MDREERKGDRAICTKAGSEEKSMICQRRVGELNFSLWWEWEWQKIKLEQWSGTVYIIEDFVSKNELKLYAEDSGESS